MNQIQQIKEKFCLIQAEHDRPSSKGRSTEGARKLSVNLYLSKKSKVMLLWNINISLGLVNGSTGHVIGFIYKEGQKAPDLPYSIIIHFDDYKGLPFFSSIGCKQYRNISEDPEIVEYVLISPPDIKDEWVPILVSEFKWGESVNDDANHSRKQFPICLAWALTVWKSQGMTIKGLVKFLLGEREKEHFDDYKGLPFFSSIGCKQYRNISEDPEIVEYVLISPPDIKDKWVPILVSEFKWGESVNDDANHSRKQFPICLAWALTVWKSQGMTIKGLVKFLLGEREKEHGLTYVGMSRVLTHEQISIGAGCSLERLTTKISSGSKLKVRLIEDVRLNVLYEACKEFYFSN
jgi:hypothetical protein